MFIILPEGVREARVAAPLGLRDGPLQVWFVDGADPNHAHPPRRLASRLWTS